MTNKLFVVYAHKNDFDDDLSTGVINQYQIVFIEDTKQIWTQNTFYSCPLTEEEILYYIQGLKDSKVDKVEGKELISTALILKLEEIDTDKIQSDILDVDSKVMSLKDAISSTTVNGKLITTNPVLTKEDIGLNNVDNTSDLDKPISTATLKALDGKADIADLSNVLAVDVYGDYEIEDIESAPIDLSKVDIYGNTIKLTTANCYVVKEAGTYKFPVAYGVALKDGAVNSIAYTNNGASTSMDFVNALGNAITSPYIEEDTGLALDSASLSISDTDGIFSNISIISGSPCKYIRFKVNKVPNTGANGVISVTGENGEILWNWHIWVWKDDLTPFKYTHDGKTYEVLPVNLASKWDTSRVEPTKIKNWYYLWGRSVPILCAASYNSSENSNSYGALTFGISSCPEGMDNNYKLGITEPTTFFTGSLNWFSNVLAFYNLWDLACTDIGASDNIIVKTVYDPCPVGFTVPNANALLDIEETYYDSTSGKTYSLTCPGIRRHDTGLILSHEYDKELWTAATYNYYLAYSQFCSTFETGTFAMVNSYRPYGIPIRPVVDMSYPEHSGGDPR